jgi:hypothetical protein
LDLNRIHLAINGILYDFQDKDYLHPQSVLTSSPEQNLPLRSRARTAALRGNGSSEHRP